MELVRLFGFFFPFVSFLSGFTVLIMLAVGGIRVINDLMTPGSLVAMFRYLTMLIWPLMGAGFMVNMIQRGAVSLGRINEILNTEPSIKNIIPRSFTEEEWLSDKKLRVAPWLENLNNGKYAIEICDMKFSYSEEIVLENINLTVNRGEWLGIMGKTGSGKTTLVKTFMRMLDPPAGTVRVFGLDVRDWSLEELRRLFAVCPQDSYLFSDTIANNITYGKDIDAFDSMQQDLKNILDKTISLAALNKDLDYFQHGKDTLVGERGLTLSGGQKQRTAIARAAIMDAEILILDDSLSAVDNETEQKILQALWKERKGRSFPRTTIIISHRVSTLRYADNVLVLDKGKTAEYGTPEKLLSTGGFYSRMANFQRLEQGK
jgi:ATP-binding cassette subfamily B protein